MWFIYIYIYKHISIYTPQNKHGTWKWTLGKGDSYWKPSFPGSMLIFGGVPMYTYMVHLFYQPGYLWNISYSYRFNLTTIFRENTWDTIILCHLHQCLSTEVHNYHTPWETWLLTHLQDELLKPPLLPFPPFLTWRKTCQEWLSSAVDMLLKVENILWYVFVLGFHVVWANEGL